MSEENKANLEEKKLPQEPTPKQKQAEELEGLPEQGEQSKGPGAVNPRRADKKKLDEEEYDDGDDDDSDDEEDEEDDSELDEATVSSVLQSIMENSTVTFDGTELGNLLETEGFDAEFKSKAIQIFEAAVNVAVSEKIQTVLEAAEITVRTKLEERYEQLEEEASEYIDAVVQEWKEENKLAIESGLRLENAESFMAGLKSLFEQHYVDVPEEKADIFNALVEESEELEQQLGEQLSENEKLAAENLALRKTIMVESFVKDMTAIQAERMKSLVESVAFVDEDSFASTLETLEENFLEAPAKQTEKKQEQLNEGEQSQKQEVSDVDRIADWMSRF